MTPPGATDLFPPWRQDRARCDVAEGAGMRALSPGFLTSLLKIVLDVAIVVLWGLLVLASLVTLSMMAVGLFRVLGMGPELPEAFLRFLQLDIVIALPLGVAGDHCHAVYCRPAARHPGHPYPG